MNFGICIYLIIRISIIVLIVKFSIKILKINKYNIFFILPLLFIYNYDFRLEKTEFELKKYNEERNAIIKEIKDFNTPVGELPLQKYKYISNDKTIYIYQNDEKQVINFWIYRGYEASVELIYSSGGKETIYNNIDSNYIKTIKELKDNWYYVEVSY